MACRRRFFIVLAFLAFFILSAAQPVWATTLPAPIGSCGPNNITDKTAAQNSAAAGQAKANQLETFWAGLQKTDVAQSYCGQNIINLYNSLVSGVSGFADPGAALGGLLGGMLGSALGNAATNACADVVSGAETTISSAIAAVHLCVPTSDFGFNLGNFGFTISGCTGGTQAPLLGNGGGYSPYNTYSNSWYPAQ